ncbi:YceD family protein [Thiohalophilus sp.]|uniref:YceD family protein n=1 Tax=Thiohalophilus sp. TaxID=3028392 RepID=UPI003974C875
MSRRQDRLPVQVDPYRLAEQGREYDGELPLRQMKRLLPLLATETGVAAVSLRFGVDEMGVHYLHGTIQADLSVACQRCLEAMRFPAEIDLSLGFVGSTAEADRLPGDHEPYIVESVPVMLADIIEDELLLALPQIPMHDLEECPAQDYVEPEEEQDKAGQDNPFQVLADLKKTPDKD